MSKRTVRPLLARSALLLALPLSGCFAYGRGQVGTAFGTSDQRGHSGPIVTADTAFRTPFWRGSDADHPSPLVLQTSLEALIAPQRKDIGWGTGLGLITPLVPVGGLFIVGTNAHFGFAEGETSLGGVSPYIDLGVRAPISSDTSNTERQPFLSLDLTGQTYFDFLRAGPPEHIVCIKFGAGWGN
jgi:hypothetical protein